MHALSALAALLALVGCRGPAPGELEFDEATSRILSSARSAASGNGAEAEKLAERFGAALRDRLVEGRDGPTPEEKPVTYCQLRDDHVCFLVRVPRFREYQGEARARLTRAAWDTAASLTKELRRRKDRKVGVALRGPFAYGAAALGMGNAEPAVQQGFAITPSLLYECFAP
jgi:hypothetical protein